MFPPGEVFDRLYLPFLLDIQFRQSALDDLASLVKTEFLELNANLTKSPYQCRPLASRHGVLQQGHAPGSCFTCLAHVPSNTLTCGHRLCDTCILKSCHPLHKCSLCARVNEVSFHPKPATAGVRILRLSGQVSDAREIALLLKALRSQLSGSLPYYFDLVLCSGVGAFFAVMMLWNGASIEDCMYHIAHLHKLKIKKRGFDFGARLKFGFSELQRSQTKLVLCFAKRIIPSYMYVL